MHDGNEQQLNAPSERSDDQSDPFFQVTGAELPPGYSFIRTLGQGQMAHVFLVRNTALKRLAAVKVLRSELAADKIGRKRFIREAQAAASIHHPSVTAVFTVGTLSNQNPFIEMQYVDGSNLAEVLRANGRFDVPTARKLLAQLAGALAAAHECRVIHRDVEPANVLIEPENDHAFLTDFGIAAILESGSEAVTRLTREGDRLGDPTYMSPEQLRGEVLTPKSDVYSLGLLGYEMLTLHGPFVDAEVTDIAAAQIRRAPVELHARHPEIPSDISDTLQRCLSKKPEHRPHAKALADMLAVPESISIGATASVDDEATSALSSFLRELQKRKVYRTAVTYAAIVFVILQVADLILPPLTAPGWIYRLIVVASLAGFPIILALAWVFDIRQGRILRADEVPESSPSRASRVQRLLMQIAGLALSIAISAATAWWLLAP